MCNTYGADDEKRERRRRQRQKCFNIIKKCVAFMFSHIGLAAMVVAYSIMGGFLFRALEAPHELKEKLKIKASKEDKINEIVKYTYNLNLGNMDSDNFTASLRAIFLEFQTEVTIAVKDKGWDGRDTTDETDLQWSFAGALLYAVTVITTIGYGHVAPKTSWGRLVTIIYALIGIPLTFLYLSNIGNFLADCFRLFYKKICCDLCCCQRCERKRKRERLRAKRRKEIAAQRNSLLQQASMPSAIQSEPQFHIQDETSMSDLDQTAADNPAYDDTIDPDTGQSIMMNIEPKLNNLDKADDRIKSGNNSDGCKLKGGCPLSVENDEVDNGKLNENNHNGASKRETPNLSAVKETAILDDDMDSMADIRETAILDDNTSDDNLSNKLPSRKPSMKKDIDGLNLPNSKSKMDGIYNQLDDVKETAILDSEDGLTDDDEDVFVDSEEGPEIGDRIDSGDENLEGCNTIERKEKLSRREKRLLAQQEKERKKKEKKEKQQQEKEKKEREKKEKQEKKQQEKLEKEQKEKEKKSLKEKEKEMKRQKSKERSRSSEKNRNKKEDKSVLVDNEPIGLTSSPVRSQTPNFRQNSRPNDRSVTPTRSPRSNHRSRLSPKDSPKALSRSKSFQERGKKDKPKVGVSPTRCSSLTERDLLDKDLLKSERDYGTLKDMPPSRKLKREKTSKFKQKQQESKRRSKEKAKRQRSTSVEDFRRLDSENKNKAYQASDESFVTARADSVSNFGETSTIMDDDETGEVAMGDNPVFKYNPNTMTVEVGNGQFDIELLEYPHLKQDGHISFVEDPFDYDEEEEDGKVTVPISICLIIITGYIFAGSLLFAVWEEWDYLTGSYFCFITLSTIGFGDIVPGTDMKEWESNEKLVLCALWLAFGLSLLAMCFNLMQEEVKEKCKWVGRKLGLLKDEDEG